MVVSTDVVDVILRDGSALRLRPPGREDAEALLGFFGGLSEQSRYLRFHGQPRSGPRSSSTCWSPTGPSAARCSARSLPTRARTSSRSPRTCACEIRRSPSRPSRRGRLSGARRRHSPARAARTARRGGRYRALRRRGAAGRRRARPQPDPRAPRSALPSTPASSSAGSRPNQKTWYRIQKLREGTKSFPGELVVRFRWVGVPRDPGWFRKDFRARCWSCCVRARSTRSWPSAWRCRRLVARTSCSRARRRRESSCPCHRPARRLEGRGRSSSW
jgi:hypothetical protein